MDGVRGDTVTEYRTAVSSVVLRLAFSNFLEIHIGLIIAYTVYKEDILQASAFWILYHPLTNIFGVQQIDRE
jgi:hypothetical protein